ncbi:hypothetical protein [Clostridium thermosuccinogenes]|jgi:hypothetical protein|uniref:hypothetical protein n=1 Tax=Clostridium thermosuccinogenes TaxID=84032 RepID=UPI000CCC5433|nr:hypothetical protein [Pseudoclostridium thermosuccinogenes]PNT93503.1 hypothetical protein CDQ83_08380 [Pseudoclostridium thermosuccinogenes]
MIDGNLTGIIIVGILALIPVSIVTVVKITEMKLKIEQIRAQTAIRTEEIQAKNRLDIEKLLMKDDTSTKDSSIAKGSPGMESNHLRMQEGQRKNFPLSEDVEDKETKAHRRKADA